MSCNTWCEFEYRIDGQSMNAGPHPMWTVSRYSDEAINTERKAIEQAQWMGSINSNRRYRVVKITKHKHHGEDPIVNGITNIDEEVVYEQEVQERGSTSNGCRCRCC